jgi:hypothetical protein
MVQQKQKEKEETSQSYHPKMIDRWMDGWIDQSRRQELEGTKCSHSEGKMEGRDSELN